jgi:hypothetical protein
MSQSEKKESGRSPSPQAEDSMVILKNSSEQNWLNLYYL